MTFRMWSIALALAGLVLTGCVSQKTPGPAHAAGATDRVAVLYMHRLFRCPACNRIERQAHQVVSEEFAEELGAGRVTWEAISYQQGDDADPYNLDGSSLVLVSYRDGRETSHEILGEVWLLDDDPAAFREYVAGAIRERLAELDAK